MPAEGEHIEEHGLSRRQVLTRGAVAAGVVWAAPVIRTATAYATSSAGTERPCINFYLVAVDPLGLRPVRFAPDSKFGYDDMPDDALAAMAAATTTTTSSTSTSSTTTSSTTTSSTTTTTTKPPQKSAAQRRASRRSTTTTTTTTRPDLPDRGFDESASQFLAEPTTTSTTKPKTSAARPRPRSATTSTTRRSGTANGAAPVEDFGLFTESAVTPPPAVPGAAPDPHATAIAAATAAAEAGTPDALPPGIKDWLTRHGDVPLRYPTAEPMVTQLGDEAWAIVLAAVDGPDPLTHQCRAVNGWATSGGKHAEFFVDPSPPVAEEDGRRLIFPNPRTEELATDPSALIETVIFVFCCPQ